MMRRIRSLLTIRSAAVLLMATAFVSLFYLFDLHDTDYVESLVPSSLTGQKVLKGSNHGGASDWPNAAQNHGGKHPIDELIAAARSEFDQVLGRQSATLEEAARRYRERRGRHPPPGFDEWFAAAQKADAVVVEDFFDRIHHDINPLWALDPAEMRRKTSTQPFVIRIRDGRVTTDSDAEEDPYRVQQWSKLVEEMASHMPDLDMPVNIMDEPRITVPWEKISEYATVERAKRNIFPASEAATKYGGLGHTDDTNEVDTEPYDPGWIRDDVKKVWNHIVDACPPESPARNTTALESHDEPVEYPGTTMPYTHKGYVRNFTASQDPCQQPHLRGMHGTFIEPVSMSMTHELLPLFGESKMPRNNEILIPGAVYLDDSREEYSGGNAHGVPWSFKKDAVVWRGASSGARNKEHNWWHIHRHRFVQMLNGTTVGAAEARAGTGTGTGKGNSGAVAESFRLLPPETYVVEPQVRGQLGAWVSAFADVGFTDILCEPPEFWIHWWHGRRRSKTCKFASPHFSVLPEVSMRGQYGYKYLPDVDGQSFSGRYRAFLLSTSMVLKSTIYAEWHDDRLFPWVHFAPFDSSYMDIYGVMDYFLHGHDAEAEAIAQQGKEWAEKVLRRVDMKLYVWRLLLEYARVADDSRDRLAFVGDLAS